MEWEKIIAAKDAHNARLEKLVFELMEKLDNALVRISELEQRLQQNSGNSSKSPSSDMVKQRPALKPKGGKSGGQAGHQGDTLKMVAKPDEIVRLFPNRCTCGKRLLRQEMEISQRRQVFDIPEPKLMVREFQQLSCTCPGCGQVNTGTFPEAVKAPVQYGNGVKTLVTLLNVKCQLSLKNISGLFSDLFGQPINEATLIGAIKTSYAKLAPVADSIKAKLQSGAVLHADETGVQVAGERNWMHTISSENYTYLYVDSSRGKKAIEANYENLFTYSGLLVHDCFGSYWGMEKAKHVLCNAHILRELTACKEQGRTWAAQMHDLLMQLYHNHKKEILLTPTHEAWKAYDQITQLALQEEPGPEVKPNKRGRLKRTKGRNLAERLIKYKTEILRFALEKGVPFTNNLAERDIRPVKGKQKIAGCFRTWQGAKHYARLQSVFSTWRKLQRSAFLELRQILDGSSFDWNLETT